MIQLFSTYIYDGHKDGCMQTDKFLLMTENHTYRVLAPLCSHFRLKVASLVLYLVEFCK